LEKGRRKQKEGVQRKEKSYIFDYLNYVSVEVRFI